MAATRLDRLIGLVEKGSTPATRKAAAKQIGEVHRLHSNDLQQLLRRLHTCLRSKTWDTRIAAAAAFDAIAENTPLWEPKDSADAEENENDDEDLFEFSSFDMLRVLEQGSHLLGSSGTEYAMDAELRDLSPQARLQKQRANLQKQLGLDHHSGGVEALFNSEDIDSKETEEQASGKRKRESEFDLERSGQSVREINRAKRLAKKKSKQTSQEAHGVQSVGKSNAKKTIVTDQADPNMVVIESRVDTEKVFISANIWPFQPRCELLAHDLFHQSWEIRHGAGLGLRDIIKKHGASAGKQPGLSEEENRKKNILWLEDMAIRLLCVEALDRFGDYITDQVVAPVRDTCGQTLGAVLKHLPMESVQKVMSVLLLLRERPEWEVRHGGLLGVKYLVAIRRDLVPSLIPVLLPAIKKGLRDIDDDVRAAAADALLPISEIVIQQSTSSQETGNIVIEILTILWDALEDLDDLSASTSSVMRLLASLLSHVTSCSAGPLVVHEENIPLEALVPRLWPFFRHTLASVREAVLGAIKELVESAAAGAAWIAAVLPDLLSHSFQNLLLEEKGNLLQLTVELWELFMHRTQPEAIVEASKSKFPPPKQGIARILSWFNLVVTPSLQPMDQKFLLVVQHNVVHHKHDKDKKKKKAEPLPTLIGGSNQAISPDESTVLRSRLTGCAALGQLIARWESGSLVCVEAEKLLIQLMDRNSAIQRLCAAIIAAEWAKRATKPISTAVVKRLNVVLTETVSFLELNDLVASMRGEVAKLLSIYINAGLAQEHLTLGPAAKFTVDRTLKLATSVSLEWDKILGSTPHGAGMWRDRLTTRVEVLETEFKQYQWRITSAIAYTFIVSNSMPPKLNPVIKPLMEHIGKEPEELLQQRSAVALSLLLQLCIDKPKVLQKITKNVCRLLCKDTDFTPEVTEDSRKEGILTYRRHQSIEAKEQQKRLNRKRKQSAVGEMDEVVDAAVSQVVNEEKSDAQRRVEFLNHRGAEAVIKALCDLFGEKLLTSIPALWEFFAKPIQEYLTPFKANGALVTKEQEQELVSSFHVLQTLAEFSPDAIAVRFLELLPLLFSGLYYPCVEIRFTASCALARIIAHQRIQTEALQLFITEALPGLGDSTNTIRRQGVAEAVYHAAVHLDLKIVPYIVLMVIPVLGRMSDGDQDVRHIVSRTFATLIRLMPLESGVPNPPGMSDALAAQKLRERAFLEQLLDSSKIEHYRLPVKINAELRSYQQSGIDWMNFLKKYQLHGILCDDMGLGKTLQSICMMASDTFERAQQYQTTGQVDCQPLPCMVVCPPTIMSHWYMEIKKFDAAGVLKPVKFQGSKAEKMDIVRQLEQGSDVYNVVILSYDVLRNSIAYFQPINFNYVILDEGHIIKNAKSKVSMATKSLSSNHRMILSGTPIQNNVLELWSLFDFLMPGFLGSERQFVAQYSKPISASRDEKASSKMQESGSLALEALHRQVLPFLLRRMKQDVLDDLPPKIIQDYYCDLSPLQLRLYESFHNTRSNIVAAVKKEGGVNPEKKGHIFQALQYLRKVCNHPALALTPAHKDYEEIMRELKKNGETIHDIKHAAKLPALLHLFRECGIGQEEEEDEVNGPVVQHRVLMFAQSKAMLDAVENDLFQKHLPRVSYLRMDGGTPNTKRQDLVNQFNDDPTIDVLLLTTHVGGVGLNLTGADTVIFLEHDWNPMKDLQAMDRAHRIGQKKVVNVYRLITRGTLEEKINTLQKFKLNIANTVVSKENSSLASMGTDQLLDLFQGPTEGSAQDDGQDGGAQSGSAPSGMKSVMADLGELWDDKQYTDEYNLDDFISSMK